MLMIMSLCTLFYEFNSLIHCNLALYCQTYIYDSSMKFDLLDLKKTDMQYAAIMEASKSFNF